MKDETLDHNCGQFKENLSERIQVLYLNQLGHKPKAVSWNQSDKTLTIIIEDSITQPEKILVENNHYQLAKQVRLKLQKAIEPQLRELISEVFNVDVIDFLCDSTFDTDRTSVIAILANEPVEELTSEMVSEVNSDG